MRKRFGLMILMVLFLLSTTVQAIDFEKTFNLFGVRWGASRENVEKVLFKQGYEVKHIDDVIPPTRFYGGVPAYGRAANEIALALMTHEKFGLYAVLYLVDLPQGHSSDKVTEIYEDVELELLYVYGPVHEEKTFKPKGSGNVRSSTWKLLDETEIVLFQYTSDVDFIFLGIKSTDFDFVQSIIERENKR